jgi:Ni/Co efflux regulator RcnB
MKKTSPTARLLALALVSILAASPAFAKGGDEHGNGHGRGHDKDKHEQQERHGDRRVEDVRVGGYFNDEHRNAVRHYYSERYGQGKACPPGLAKKHNGCMPPGQARKLAVGERVPSGVTLYPVPQPVVVQLPPPPYGYRYARVGNDIVLVRNNNQVIVDIIAGLLG